MMITSRTPLRVSFFGGGTDYPEYFQRHRGAVVGMAVDKYIYISTLKLSNFLQYKYRVSYSKLETVHDAAEIEHPVVRAVLQHYGIDDALDISVLSDLPSSSGLGSSSAFTVGLLNLVNALKSVRMTKLDLGNAAIHVERHLLGERVGVQDQLHAAFGGINRFDFVDGRIKISPIQMTAPGLTALLDSLVLIYTRINRFASETLDEQLEATAERRLDNDLGHLLALTDDAVEILEQQEPDRMLAELGTLLDEGWQIKRRLSSRVSNDDIDQLYQFARDNGALGGKLCGAGGGGFLLMLVPPERQAALSEILAPTKLVKLGLDTQGSTIIYG